MHQDRTAAPQTSGVRRGLDDAELACESQARLLITAGASETVESLARRIHDASARAGFPFVRIPAEDLPADPHELVEVCSGLLAAANGGSVLLMDVEKIPPPAQERLIEVIIDLEAARPPSAAVRVIAGTTVPLLDRVAAGTFSERLFYRLNIIHLMTT